MKGYLYKDFMLARFSLLTTAIAQVIASATAILIVYEAGFGFVSVLPAMCSYLLVFEVNSFINIDMFVRDERTLWKNFTLSVSDGAKKQVKSKYVVVFVSMIFIALVCCITDMICRVISKEQEVSLVSIILIVFCIKLVTTAIELPFVFRYGSTTGIKVKGTVIACIFGILILYLLFGDISIFLEKNFFKVISELFKSTWFKAALLCAAGLGYLLSYKISLKCYIKEGGFDE